MYNIDEQLAEFGLRMRQSDDPEREAIDFTVEDEEDNVAYVWGSEPWNDIQVECNHPYQCIEFGDHDEQGECLLCGAMCDWHGEPDEEGHAYPTPHEWYSGELGGILGDYIKELQRRF